MAVVTEFGFLLLHTSGLCEPLTRNVNARSRLSEKMQDYEELSSSFR